MTTTSLIRARARVRVRVHVRVRVRVCGVWLSSKESLIHATSFLFFRI